MKMSVTSRSWARQSNYVVPNESILSLHHSADDIKPCPRCAAYIVKMNDGSCNHMTCAVCGCEFCWLCMKEISDLHYLRSVSQHANTVEMFYVKYMWAPVQLHKQLASHDFITAFIVLTVITKEPKSIIAFSSSFPSPLYQSVRLYFLGKEAMEQEEEDSLATGNTGGGPCWHCTHRRHSYPCNDNRHPRLCGTEGEATEAHSLAVTWSLVRSPVDSFESMWLGFRHDVTDSISACRHVVLEWVKYFSPSVSVSRRQLPVFMQ